jgi:predicted nuclease with TOPRIM domain
LEYQNFANNVIDCFSEPNPESFVHFVEKISGEKKMVRVKDEALTLEGLRELLRMKERGEDLPENWKDLVQDYIEWKFNSVEKWEKHLKKMKEQLKEAIGIASALNVSIKIVKGV